MTLKFNLMATIEVPNADKFPTKEEIEKSIAEILEFEGMISHELAVTDYRADEESELPAVQPDHVADVSKKVSISCGRENDLISRQAAIDAAKHAWAKGLEPSQYIEIIPPAQPEPHWIPCTERMPHNTGDFYLCTAKLSVDDEYEVELLMLDTANDFDKSYFSKCIHNGLVFRESWSGGNEALDVIAWMPLPEPYRGGEKE